MGISSRISSGHSEHRITLPSCTPPLNSFGAPGSALTGDAGQPCCSGMWSVAGGKALTKGRQMCLSILQPGCSVGEGWGCSGSCPLGHAVWLGEPCFFRGFLVLGKLLQCLSFPTKCYKQPPHCCLS